MTKEQEIRSATDLVKLRIAERILESISPRDDRDKARKECFIYQVRESRMISASLAGKAADRVMKDSDVLAEEFIKRMNEIPVR